MSKFIEVNTVNQDSFKKERTVINTDHIVSVAIKYDGCDKYVLIETIKSKFVVMETLDRVVYLINF